MPPGQKFSVVPGTYAICRLPVAADVPPWAASTGGFTSVTRTADELSIVCEERRLPAGLDEAGVQVERGWVLLKLHGPFSLDAIGIFASVANPLAKAGISLLAIGTFDTDYLLVKRAHTKHAVATLTRAGHTLMDR
jgi:hypothetical protein